MTQKEYTGPEFEIEFARAWLKYVEGGKVGVDPRENWECLSRAGTTIIEDDRGHFPMFVPDVRYRWKPKQKRMVRIGYRPRVIGELIEKWLVAPEVEAPSYGSIYYSSEFLEKAMWSEHKLDHRRLEHGVIFLTREDAQAMSDWLAVCRKGGQS